MAREGGLGLVQRWPKRGHEAEQRRRLVADLVCDQRADSVACDSLAQNTHDRDGALAAADEPLRARWARSAVQALADLVDRRGLEGASGALMRRAA